MVPLTTRQGIAAEELRALIGGREVAVWGVGDIAAEVLTSLRKSGVEVGCLLHSQGGGKGFRSLPIRPAASVLAEAGGPSRRFVVLATAAFRRAAEAACLAAGWRKNADFVSHLSIARPHAVVEIASGAGDAGRADPPSMALAAFQEVLGKLAGDLPLLSRIEFAGEPLVNSELVPMIRLAERIAPCTVTTRLPDGVSLDPVVAAAPSRVDIVVDGQGDAARPGGAFLRRLGDLRAAIARHEAPTRFRVVRYRRRHEPADLDGRWQDCLRDSGIGLATQVPYVMPYDRVLAYCDTGVWPAEALASAASLPWDIDRALAACAADAHLPCLSQRVFPVVRDDRSVHLCHLYDGPAVAEDYLAVSWSELLRRRHDAPHCRSCQRHGLHRLDLDVLAGRHPATAFDV